MLDPTNIQALGVIISAFIGILIAAFSFLNAPHKKSARAFGYIGLAILWWGIFGYLFHATPSLELGYDFRVLSLVGNVFILWSALAFTFFYIKEEQPLPTSHRRTIFALIAAGVPIIFLLISDLFNTGYVVKEISVSPREVLAPVPGPFLIVLAGYFLTVTAAVGAILLSSVRREENARRKKQTRFMSTAIVLALLFGSLGFLPWYGIDLEPLLFLRALAVPLFAVASLYAISNYRFLNLQIVATEIFVYAIWTFMFFRIFLHESLGEAVPDIFLGIVILILGVFLIRSAIREVRLRTERIKNEFVSIAAHQLRTPASAIHWTFELLLSGDDSLTEKQRDLVMKGKHAARNMTSIINDLLNVAMVSGGKFAFTHELEDMRNAVKVGVSALEEAAKEKNITLTKEIPDEPLSAYFDIGKFTLAIENVLDNAIKYTPEGGTVRVAGRKEGGKIIVEITDSGIGISPSEQRRLFEKFFRGDRAKEMFINGSGLGLFIVKTIIDGHDGSIHVSSTENEGTTVRLELPVGKRKK